MIMKTKNIFRFAAVLLTAMSMLALNSCEDPIDEPDEPNTENNGGNENGGNGSTEPEAANFPDLVENYEVKPGSTLELTFTPNYKWEVSVPSETFKYFWILDGAFKVDKLSGTASEEAVKITIGVSDEEEFDNNRSCEVTLKMNDESKVIAKYMRPAKNRTLSVYSAQLDADGNLQTGSDGTSYVYGESESESVALVWSETDADFRLPVKIDANCEWTVSVPEWLDVEVPEKTSGVVELVLTGVSLDGNNGKITFKAGEEVLKEIEVTIPSCKGVSLWEAVVTEGELEYGEDGYVWSEKPAESVALVWLGADFRMPVKVSSKCNWTLVLPEWLSADVPAETAGEIELTFTGVSSKYPLKDTEGKIVFKVGESVLHEIPVKIPGCSDIMTFSVDMSLTELAYDAAGWVKTTSGYIEGPATGRLFGTKDVKVCVVETTGGTAGSEPSWFKANLSAFNAADGADVLQERTVTFKAEENTGFEERSAVVFFLPPGVTASGKELFNDDASVKEEFIKYSVQVHQLSSVYDDYLEVSSEEDSSDYLFEKADDVKASALTSEFGSTDHVYVLTYNAEYTRVWMNMAVAYDSYKVFAAEDKSSDKSADSAFWLQFEGNEARKNGVFDMYKEMTLPTEPSTGYVVFYDKDDDVLAIVECVSPFKEEEIVTPPDDDEEDLDITDEYGNVYVENTSYFTDPEAAAAAGAKLYELKSGPYYDQYKEVGCPILLLEYDSVDTVAEIKVPSKIKWFQVMQYSYSNYITVNDLTIYETSGIMNKETDVVKIKMLEEVSTKKTEIENNKGVKVLLHKNMSTQDPTLVIFCRLTLE